MATKNNFSKAVLDLMGLPGNDSTSGERAQDTAAETAFDQNKRVETGSGKEFEADRETD